MNLQEGSTLECFLRLFEHRAFSRRAFRRGMPESTGVSHLQSAPDTDSNLHLHHSAAQKTKCSWGREEECCAPQRCTRVPPAAQPLVGLPKGLFSACPPASLRTGINGFQEGLIPRACCLKSRPCLHEKYTPYVSREGLLEAAICFH